MLVRELIDILSDHPGDLEVELAVIAPVEEDSDDITVDRYPVDGVLPWEDDDAELSAEESRVIWLIGGEEDDVEAFLDAVEEPDELSTPPSRRRSVPPRRARRPRRRRRQRNRRGGRRRPRRVRGRGAVRRRPRSTPPRRRPHHDRRRRPLAPRPPRPGGAGAVLDARGAPDILVTTPAVNVRKRIADYTDDDLDRVVDLNLKGVFRLLPDLRRGDGRRRAAAR